MRSVIALVLFVSVASAEDAPQFRGAGGLGVSQEKGLPTQWDGKTNLRWKAALPGRGLSNPVIANGRAYVTASSSWNQARLHLLCFDVKDGKKLWERQLWATGQTQCHPKTNMAAPTPITDGDRVYAMFASGDMVCYDKDGNLIWFRTLMGDYPSVGNALGLAASPILWNDLVLLCLENVGESFAAGIDKNTGQNRWRIDRPRGLNWVTPLVINNDGQPEVLFQEPGALTAYEPATGKKRWTATTGKFSTQPSPSFGGGMVFSPGDKLMAIKPPAKGDEPTVVWTNGKMPSGYPSPTYYQGKIYTLNTRGVLNCADAATGKALWDQRLEGTYAGSPLIADGKLYAVNEEGITVVIDLSGNKANIIANNPLGGEVTMAAPVAADQAIFLRSDNHLYCVSEKK